MFAGCWFVVGPCSILIGLTVGWSHVWWVIYDVAGRRVTRHELGRCDKHGQPTGDDREGGREDSGVSVSRLGGGPRPCPVPARVGSVMTLAYRTTCSRNQWRMKLKSKGFSLLESQIRTSNLNSESGSQAYCTGSIRTLIGILSNIISNPVGLTRENATRFSIVGDGLVWVVVRFSDRTSHDECR